MLEQHNLTEQRQHHQDIQNNNNNKKKPVTRGVTKEIHVAKNNRETRETCCRLYCITN